MKHLILFLALFGNVDAQTRAERLIAEYEAHPNQQTYQRATREIERLEKVYRRQRRRLKAVIMPRANERFCDGTLDERKMRGWK